MKGCSLVAGNMVRERKTAEAVEVPPGPSYTQLKLGVNEKGSRVVTKDLPIRAKRMERAGLPAPWSLDIFAGAQTLVRL